MDEVTISGRPTGPQTLAIDVGGTHLKAGILSPDGSVTAGPSRVDTPHPAPPDRSSRHWSVSPRRSDGSGGSRSASPAWCATVAC